MLLCGLPCRNNSRLIGKWTGTIRTLTEMISDQYVFKVDGDKLTGTGQGDGDPSPITEGKISGDDITFKVTSQEGKVFPHAGNTMPRAIPYQWILK